MSGLLIVGAGGHAKVVADILLSQGANIIGFLDDDPSTWGGTRLGLPVLGGIDSYAGYSPDGLVMGVGSNMARKQVVERLGGEAGGLWRNAIHPKATVANSVRLGVGIVVAARAVVNPDSVLGDHVIINTGAIVDHDCTIGTYAHIAPGARLAGGVRVGEGTLIGIGASVIPLRALGGWAIVGAGAVVIDDIPDGVTAKGVPARWERASDRKE
jgi:sugar O-acyltransferase (sialic acid O-acetyltransferase NeuD family)